MKLIKPLRLTFAFIALTLALVLAQQPIAYPAKGQSAQQQQKDEGECHYNRGRPHMSLGPGVPDPPPRPVPPVTRESRHRLGERLVVRAKSVLGGLHHEYSLAPALA
jgi:hypothetical protein